MNKVIYIKEWKANKQKQLSKPDTDTIVKMLQRNWELNK